MFSLTAVPRSSSLMSRPVKPRLHYPQPRAARAAAVSVNSTSVEFPSAAGSPAGLAHR